MTQKTKLKQTEIGIIPEDWEVKKLNELLFIKGRIGWKGLKKSEFGRDGIIIINGPNIKNGKVVWKNCLRVPKWRYDESQEISVKKNDILMTKDGTIGKMAHVTHLPEPATLASGIFLIRSKSEKLDQDFLYQYFNSPFFKSLVESRIEGSVIPHLYQRDIEQLSIPFPSSVEQQSIAKILSDLDSKIELNQNMNKTFEALSKVIFKHWFIDFEFPNKEGKPYKSSGGDMTDNEELGKQIPKGWEVVPLDQAAEFTRGFSYRGSEKSKIDGEYAFVTLNSVKEFGGFKREFSYITSDRVKEKNFVYRGDIVVANTEQTKTGTLLGYPALVEFPLGYEKGKGIFSHHITKVIPKLKNLKHYLYYHLFINQQNAVKYNTGSVIWALDVSNWSKNEKIILPEEKLLQKFESSIEIMFLKLLENNLQIETLSRLRETILPKLMSGKIRVPVGVK